MEKKIGLVVSVMIGLALIGYGIYEQMDSQKSTQVVKQTSAPKEDVAVDKKTTTTKSQIAKQATMEMDLETMDSLGLYYDYANLSLVELVQAYMAEYGIDASHVAFSYKNIETSEIFSHNDTVPMTAGSTYKLPLNMKIVDQVEEGVFNMEDEYDITSISYEYQGEYDAYRAQFGDGMTIPEMQKYSILYSENTPAHAMVAMLGGDWQGVYDSFSTYGKSKGTPKTIDLAMGNKTTTDFYIQVLDYLYRHREKYADITALMDASFTGQYYEGLLPSVQVIQKPGYVAEALNVDAIVMEESPYLIALYTRYLGGSDEQTEEVNGYGYYQLTQLAYVINEWHRVNYNPMPADFDEQAWSAAQAARQQETLEESQEEEVVTESEQW